MAALIQGDEESFGRERMETPSPVHHPSPARKPSHTSEEKKKQMEEAERQGEEARRLEDVGRSPYHHQPNSWPRWLQRPGHLVWVRRSQSGGTSNLLLEARPPRRNSPRLERSRRPGSTRLAQLLFKRSGGSKRALSSSLGNSPSRS